MKDRQAYPIDRQPSRRGIITSMCTFLVLTALFFSCELMLAEAVGAQGPSTEPSPAHADFRLVGTIEGSVFSGAVLSDAAGIHFFYRLNSMLPDGSQIVNVRNKSILLKRTDGLLYELFVTQEIKTAITAGPSESARTTEQEEVAPKPRTPPSRPHRRNRVRNSDQDD